jgi:hypothetical protein
MAIQAKIYVEHTEIEEKVLYSGAIILTDFNAVEN